MAPNSKHARLSLPKLSWLAKLAPSDESVSSAAQVASAILISRFMDSPILHQSSVVLFYAGFLLGAVSGLFVDTRRRRLSPIRSGGWDSLTILDVAAFALNAGLSAGFAATLIPTAIARSIIWLGDGLFLCVLICLGIGIFIWGEGRRQVQLQRPRGLVAGEWLILFGAFCLALSLAFPFGGPAVFRTTHAFGRLLYALMIVAGGIIVASVVPRFLKGEESHRVLERIAAQGEFVQTEWVPPTPECPHPERWQMLDPESAEIEVLALLHALIVAVKPELIVETGTFVGHSAIKIAHALRANGFGRLITLEYDSAVFQKAKQNIDASGVGRWIDYRNASSLDSSIDGPIDILFSDSNVNIREQEVRNFLPQIRPNGLVLIHDASSHFKVVREAAFRLESEGLLSVVLLSTPRGLCLAQKRDGRN